MAAKKKEYAAAGSTEGDVKDPVTGTTGDPSLMKFAREHGDKARYERLQSELGDTKARLAKIEGEKRQAERFSKLQVLRTERGYVFDMEKELGRAAKMSDDQFNEHVETIVENYQRAPIGERPLFTPSIDEPTERSNKALYAKATEISARMLRQPQRDERGNPKHVTFDECLELARKEVGSTPTKTK